MVDTPFSRQPSHSRLLLPHVLYLEKVSEDEVFSLPGWNGSLPSRMFSGYIDVSATEHVHYSFVMSENDPTNDPVVRKESARKPEQHEPRPVPEPTRTRALNPTRILDFRPDPTLDIITPRRCPIM